MSNYIYGKNSFFEALRNVEELFGDDIMSKDYWRSKLHELLLYRGKDNGGK